MDQLAPYPSLPPLTTLPLFIMRIIAQGFWMLLVLFLGLAYAYHRSLCVGPVLSQFDNRFLATLGAGMLASIAIPLAVAALLERKSAGRLWMISCVAIVGLSELWFAADEMSILNRHRRHEGGMDCNVARHWPFSNHSVANANGRWFALD